MDMPENNVAKPAPNPSLESDAASLGALSGLRLAAGRLVARLYPFFSGRPRLAETSASELFLPRDGAIRVSAIGSARCFASSDDLVGRTVLLFGDFDAKITWIVERCVGPGDITVDVGANIGAVSLRLAQIVRDSGCVHAFEPSPVALGLLRRTLEANPNLPIALHPIACGSDTGIAHMAVPTRNIGAGRIVEADGAPPEATFEVPIKPLGPFLREIGLKSVDFMKVDVEGHEPSVFRGLFEAGEPLHPKVIVYEDDRAAERPNLAILEAHGYDVFAVPDKVTLRMSLKPRSASGFLRCSDFVAIHESAPTALRRDLGVASA